MTTEELDALKLASYELTCLHGLYAYDGADPAREAFQIDVSATQARLDAILLPLVPYEVPGCGRDGEKA